MKKNRKQQLSFSKESISKLQFKTIKGGNLEDGGIAPISNHCPNRPGSHRITCPLKPSTG